MFSNRAGIKLNSMEMELIICAARIVQILSCDMGESIRWNLLAFYKQNRINHYYLYAFFLFSTILFHWNQQNSAGESSEFVVKMHYNIGNNTNGTFHWKHYEKI